MAMQACNRKRKRKESGIDILLAAPWWLSAVIAILGFIGLQWIIPAATANNPFLRGIGIGLKPFGYLVAVVCGVIAVVNYFRQHNNPSRSQSEISTAWSPPALKTAIDAGRVSKAWEEVYAGSKQTGPKPTQWSLALLRLIEWKRFEELCAAFYREIGLRSETIHCGADGGIDAKLFEADAQEPTAVIQCKAWNTRPVGVKPVRELLGVMTDQRIAKGIFITTGDYTDEAIKFANTNPIDLVNGAGFLKMLQRLSDDSRARLLAVATEGEFTRPTCPSCGTKMVHRNSERGEFWGCIHFPRCRQKFFIKPA